MALVVRWTLFFSRFVSFIKIFVQSVFRGYSCSESVPSTGAPSVILTKVVLTLLLLRHIRSDNIQFSIYVTIDGLKVQYFEEK